MIESLDLASARRLLQARSVLRPDPGEPGRWLSGVDLNLPGRVVVPAATERVKDTIELVSIEVDLEFVRDVCGILAPIAAAAGYERQASDPETVKARAYWIAALTTYARCFGGRRKMLTEDDVASLGLKREHDVVFAQRDQHVAHRVNPLELIQICAVLSLPPIERGVMGIWNSQAAQANGTDEEIAALSRLVAAVLQFVATKREQAMRDVQRQYLVLPLDDLYALEERIARPLDGRDLKRDVRNRRRPRK